MGGEQDQDVDGRGSDHRAISCVRTISLSDRNSN